MITFRINGREIKLDEPVSVLEAARRNNIRIPHFCDHTLLKPFGGCRMCLVEVKGIKRLQTACTVRPTEGMEVLTETPEVLKARKAILEFLLINHPLDCPTCDKAGECDLQDLTMLHGAEAGRFEETKRREPEAHTDPLIVRNMDRCIACTRCVRMCSDVQGDSALSVTGKGRETFIEPYNKERFNCEYCGNCITVCPVGSLMSRLHRHNYRPWDTTARVDTVCHLCGVGCAVTLQMRGDSIQRAIPRIGKGVSGGILCVRGSFGYEFAESPRRLTSPLIRKDGKLAPATWDEALDYIAHGLTRIRDAHGGKALGAIGSIWCTIEDNYMLQRLMRAGLGSNNIDTPARAGVMPARRMLESLLGTGVTANMVSGIVKSDTVLTVGGDPASDAPVLGVRVRNAHGRGACVVTVGDAPGLARHRDVAVGSHPLREGETLGAILGEAVRIKGMSGADPGFEALIAQIELPSPDNAQDPVGVRSAAAELCAGNLVSIVAGRRLWGSPDGARNLLLLAALAHVLDARIYLSSEGPNENGAVDAGCLPDRLPGDVPLAHAQTREKAEQAWGRPLPSEPGLQLMGMIEAAHRGDLKGMIVMGSNPAFSLPGSAFVNEALGRLELLVAVDAFMTETCELAHVVLPARGWAEKDGLYANLERRLQCVRAAVTNSPGREDWRILSEIGSRIGMESALNSSDEVLAELSTVSRLHKGLTYEADEQPTAHWPYTGKPEQAEPPDPALIARLSKIPPAKLPDGVVLSGENTMFHSGTITRNSEALRSVYSQAISRTSAATAARLGLEDGDTVEIKTPYNTMTLKLKLDIHISENVICLSKIFRGTGLMSMVGYAVDPATGTPYPETLTAAIRKVKA